MPLYNQCDLLLSFSQVCVYKFRHGNYKVVYVQVILEKFDGMTELVFILLIFCINSNKTFIFFYWQKIKNWTVNMRNYYLNLIVCIHIGALHDFLLLTCPQLGRSGLIEKFEFPSGNYDIVMAFMRIHHTIFMSGPVGSIRLWHDCWCHMGCFTYFKKSWDFYVQCLEFTQNGVREKQPVNGSCADRSALLMRSWRRMARLVQAHRKSMVTQKATIFLLFTKHLWTIETVVHDPKNQQFLKCLN